MERNDQIRFTLNGNPVAYSGAATDRLLDALRGELGCLSVKCGCGEGECGACAVIIDGRLMNSCCVAVGAVAGASVLTLEGYRGTSRFEAISKAFAEVSAVQCGFCTPGMVMAAEALLSRNPQPTEAEVREGLSGNICRCTGYNAIVNAVLAASREGAGLW